MIGAFIAGFIVGVVLMALAIKKGYIALKVKKRKKLKLPKDLEIGIIKEGRNKVRKIKPDKNDTVTINQIVITTNKLVDKINKID